MRALLDLRVWAGLVEACFTWKCPRFAPANQLSQIDHFDPPAGVLSNSGGFEHDWGWNRVDFDLGLHEFGPGLAQTQKFCKIDFHTSPLVASQHEM